jgi:hypothetical protein
MDDDFQWTQTAGGYANKEALMHLFGKIDKIQCLPTQELASKAVASSTDESLRLLCAARKFTEMGIGRGGKISQKIYPDPHGLDAWQAEPSAMLATYLVSGKVVEQITGQNVPEPVGHDVYKGHWFGMKDSQQGDIAGTQKFTGL